MAEGLQTEDGTPVDVPPVGEPTPDQKWAAAMAAPEPDEPQAPAPPKKDPEAPYGRRADGTPKKGPGGRPPKPKAQTKAERPRVQANRSRDFTGPLNDVLRLGWGVLAISAPADAGALKVHGPGMVEAWNALAQENATVARGIEWLTTGSAYGAVVMATVPMVLQVLANHGRLPHQQLGALGVQDPAELAEVTAADVEMMQRAAAAQAAAAAA
ncbi:hypothetical protein [Actinomadura geliboluensis]|uniref:hypothetical protein n=1 Tax=Actinomadura geliboluensis TaxID=882440 RepID=UPI00262E0591|nr:hypothetical protein [Actinomadura geliboluensis]